MLFASLWNGVRAGRLAVFILSTIGQTRIRQVVQTILIAQSFLDQVNVFDKTPKHP
jgi:hypothetical protein